MQEVVPGAANSAIGVIMVPAPDRKIILTYCVKRLRLATCKLDAGYVHPHVLGLVVWCKTVHDDGAVEVASAFVRTFEYVGQITVEFRRVSRINKLNFIKIEPRSVRATSLSTVIGMDIPTVLYAAYTG